MSLVVQRDEQTPPRSPSAAAVSHPVPFPCHNHAVSMSVVVRSTVSRRSNCAAVRGCRLSITVRAIDGSVRILCSYERTGVTTA